MCVGYVAGVGPERYSAKNMAFGYLSLAIIRFFSGTRQTNEKGKIMSPYREPRDNPAAKKANMITKFNLWYDSIDWPRYWKYFLFLLIIVAIPFVIFHLIKWGITTYPIESCVIQPRSEWGQTFFEVNAFRKHTPGYKVIYTASTLEEAIKITHSDVCINKEIKPLLQ